MNTQRQKPKRAWGFWTQGKLAILSDYLPAFLRASRKKSKVTVYIDAFAGEASGVDKHTGAEFDGSASIGVKAGGEDGFTRLRFFETESKAAELEKKLRKENPGRDIKVYPGDCNEQMAIALQDLQDVRWAPTFAFLDPDGTQLAWTTIEALADHKRGYKARSGGKEYKVELWMLFPSQGLIRALALDDEKLLPGHIEAAHRLFGDESWQVIYQARKADELTPSEATEEYVNLMRWKLTRDLGYAKTHVFEVRNTQNRLIYHMIFATDNPTGDRIMGELYGKAAAQFPAMRQHARDTKTGQLALNLGDQHSFEPYSHAPPAPPFGAEERESATDA